MYAIVDIAGQQFKVEKDQKLFVHRLDEKEGSKVTFEKVLLIDNDKNISVGDPVIKGASVSATILGHLKGDKVLVFKKKRRKGYKKLSGHRQYLSEIRIDAIAEKSAKPAASAEKSSGDKADAEKKAAPEKSQARATDAKTSASKSGTKKEPAAKKPAAKKAPAAKSTQKKTDTPKAAGKKSAASGEKKADTAKTAAKKSTGTAKSAAQSGKKDDAVKKEDKE
jgi:large subunit ribosomal protein L21